MLHSCQSRNDQKPIRNHSPGFSVTGAFWRIYWWGRGGWMGSHLQSWEEGSQLLRRLVLASTCKTIVMWAVGIWSWKMKIGLILPHLRNKTHKGRIYRNARKHCKGGKEHEFPLILPNLANTQKNWKIMRRGFKIRKVVSKKLNEIRALQPPCSVQSERKSPALLAVGCFPPPCSFAEASSSAHRAVKSV